ncbi:hypothetical protein [uncultured Shewanella sp.]|uniref:hypothetical protein n=1 Tax=uncultured Shewanella sp. TaxID=173975 RepID=UPI0026223BD3|nr:hypothetical protein [uncultured Shewanella sp.]
MHTFKLTACGLLTVLLTACGGSDSNNNNQTENAADNKGNTPSPVYLTLDAMRSNQCGMLSPDLDARFLVHDSDGNILSEHKTDSNGHLNIEWSEANQHITQLTYTEPNDQSAGVKVDTYLNVTAGDLGKKVYYIDNDIGCECNEVQIDLSELHNSGDFRFVDFAANSNIMSVFLSPASQHSESKVNWCADVKTDLILIDNNGFSTHVAQVLFSPVDNQTLTLSDFSEGIEVNITPPTDSSFMVAYTGFYQFGNDSWNTSPNSSNHDKPIYIYPELNLTSILYTHNYSSSSILDSHANINISSRQPIDDEGYTQPIELLTADESLLPEVEHIATQMQLASDTVDFDFSAYDSNISATTLRLYDDSQFYFDSDSTWSIFAGRAGTIPALKLPQDIQAKFDAIEHKKMNVSLQKIDRYLSLQEWRAQVATESRSADRANELIYQQGQSIRIDFALTQPSE